MFTFYRKFGFEPACEKICFWRMKMNFCFSLNGFGWLRVLNKRPFVCFDLSLHELTGISLAVFPKRSRQKYHLAVLNRMILDFLLKTTKKDFEFVAILCNKKETPHVSFAAKLITLRLFKHRTQEVSATCTLHETT